MTVNVNVLRMAFCMFYTASYYNTTVTFCQCPTEGFRYARSRLCHTLISLCGVNVHILMYQNLLVSDCGSAVVSNMAEFCMRSGKPCMKVTNAITHRVVKYVCSIGLLATADRMTGINYR